MTIYATPFKNSTKKCTGPSVDSGFENVDQVVEIMGEPTRQSDKYVIYGDDDDRIIYSTILFCIDEPIIKG